MTHSVRAGNRGLPTANSPGLTAGGFSPAEAIRRCATVAECHALRAPLGEMNSATYMALLMRIEALRKAGRD